MIILLLLLGYGISLALAYYFQEKFIFQTKKLPEDYSFSFDFPFQEYYLDDAATSMRIHGLFFPSPTLSAKGLILYFHGNAGNLQRWGQFAADFIRLGYDVFAIDYPGYGKSSGQPSEQNCYQSGLLAYQWARERYAPGQIIIYGRSLGSGVASWLASQFEAQQLILETPFPSLPKLIRHRVSGILAPFHPRTHFQVEEYIQRVSYPITIFQGTRDWVVPFGAAKELLPIVGQDRFIIIPHGGHKNLNKFERYHQVLAEILQ